MTTIMSGNVVSFEIGKKGDSTTTTVILQVVFSDPDDIRPVEWIPAPGEDSVPAIGSRVIVHELSSGYLVAGIGNDGAIPVSDAGGKEIYSTVVDGGIFKKMARVRCLPDGDVEIITEKNLVATVAGDLTATVTGATTIDSIGTLELKAPLIKLTGPVECSSTIDAVGDISTEADVLADGDVIADALATLITLLTHFHQGNLGYPTGVGLISGGGTTPSPPPATDSGGDLITGAGNSLDTLQSDYDAHKHSQANDSNGDTEEDTGIPI